MFSNAVAGTLTGCKTVTTSPLVLMPSAHLSPRCQRCETLPAKIIGPGTLHLRFPLTHSLGKTLSTLRSHGWRFTEDRGTVSVEIGEENIAAYTAALASALTTQEQQDIRALFAPRDQELQLADYLEADSLYQFAGRARAGWLTSMLSEERLTTHFQPIISCEDGSIYGYECLMRGVEDGKLVPPFQILELARQTNFLFQVDLAARRAAIRNAYRHGIKAKIFINFTPTAIYDPQNCLRSTVALIQECGIQPEQVVFEVIESEHVHEVKHLLSILNFYRERGFGVALDDLGAGYSSLNLLVELKPDYVKLDRDLITNVADNPYKAVIAAKLFETAIGLGVQSIAEGVETEAEFTWLQEQGATYAQGYYFARPAAEPPIQIGGFGDLAAA